jgi:F-type H+-transporting ATPase subunit delta
MKISKEARRTSRQLFKACFTNGKLDDNSVRTVVAKIGESKPRGYLAILENFKSLIANEQARSVAVVESATELDGATRDQLQNGLNTKYGRNLALTYSVNPELLGGVRIKVGSDVWDGSVKARLEALQSALA